MKNETREESERGWMVDKKKKEEISGKIRKWLGMHKKQIWITGMTAAAFMAAAGLLLCALRTAPLPADRTAASRETIVKVTSGESDTGAAAESEQSTEPVSRNSPEPDSRQKSGPETELTPRPGKSEPETELTPRPGKSGPETELTPKPEKIAVPETTPAEKLQTPAPEKEAAAPPAEAQEAALPAKAQEEALDAEAQETALPPAENPAVPAAHEHDWVPVTVTVHRDAVTHTVHHDAETEMVHHEPVTHEEPVYEYRTICNTCGEDITGHIPDHIGPVCQGSYSVQQVQTGVNIVTDTEAFDEEIVVRNAWDETVVDREAFDETVTAGWRCSICGIMKE